MENEEEDMSCPGCDAESGDGCTSESINPDAHVNMVSVGPNQGQIICGEGRFVTYLSDYSIPDYVLLQRAHSARKQAQALLEAAENMERLCRTA